MNEHLTGRRSSIWTEKLRVAYGIPEEVDPRNVEAAAAVALAKGHLEAETPPISTGPNETEDWRQHVDEAYRIAPMVVAVVRQLGDGGLLDRLLVPLTRAAVNRREVVAAVVVLIGFDPVHRPKDQLTQTQKQHAGTIASALLDKLVPPPPG